MIVIRTNAKEVVKHMQNLSIAIPRAAEVSSKEIAEFAVEMYNQEAIKAGIKYWGEQAQSLFRDTRAVQKSRTYWEVRMPLHGIFLDKMKPHIVALKRGRGITRWARERGIKGRYIHVNPYPFMDAAEAKIYKKAMPILRKETRRAIKESIRR